MTRMSKCISIINLLQTQKVDWKKKIALYCPVKLLEKLFIKLLVENPNGQGRNDSIVDIKRSDDKTIDRLICRLMV